MTRKFVLVACGFVSCLLAMHYDRQGAVEYARRWQNWKINGFDGYMNWFASGGDCCKFGSRALSDSLGGKLHLWGTKDTLHRIDTCRKFPGGEPDTLRTLHLGLLDKEGQFFSIGQLKTCLRDWGVPVRYYPTESLKVRVPDTLEKGDLIFVAPNKSGNDQHVMIIDSIDRQSNHIYFDDHHGVFGSADNPAWFYCNKDLVKYIRDHNAAVLSGQRPGPPWTGCRFAHIPDTIMGCMDLKQYEQTTALLLTDLIATTGLTAAGMRTSAARGHGRITPRRMPV